MKKFYLKHWVCGRGTVHANTGENYVRIRSVGSAAEREKIIAEYNPPNHCPTAAVEAAPASDADVRRAIREPGGVLSWDN